MHIVVIITAPSQEVARNIAGTLVEERLAACCTIVPGAESVYRWEGAVETAQEWVLMAKTSRGLFDALAARVAGVHPYNVPEIIALPIEAGAAPYMAWLAEAVAR